MLKKLYKPGLISLSGLALYALCGFIVLPKVLQHQVPKLLSELTKTPVTLASASFNPFALQLELHGFNLPDKQQQALLRFAHLTLDINGLASLKNLQLVIEQLSIDQPETRIVAFKNGQFNFSSLLSTEDPPAKKSSGTPVPLLLKTLQLNQGNFTWVDEHLTPAEVETLKPLNLTLNNLSLRQDTTATLDFSAQLPVGGKIHWQLDLLPNTRAVQGTLQVQGLKAERLWALLLQDKVNFKLTKGEQDIQFNYRATLAEPLQVVLSDGQLNIRQLHFTKPDDPTPSITLPELTLQGMQFDLAQRMLNIKALNVNAPTLALASDTEGNLNLQQLFAPKVSNTQPTTATPPPATPPKTNTPAPPRWQINIAQFGIHQLQTSYRSAQPHLSFDANIAKVDFTIQDAQLQVGDTLHLQTQKTGFDLQNISLNNFQQHPKQPALQFNLGKFHTELGPIHLQTGQTLQLKANDGAIQFQQLSLLEQGSTPALFSLAEFALNGAQVDFGKQQLTLEQLQASDAKIRAWLTKDKQLNYASFVPQTPQADNRKTLTKLPSTQEQQATWTITVNKANLTNLNLDFQDRSRPHAPAWQLNNLNLTTQHLSNHKAASFPLTIKGTINRNAKFDIKGQAALEPLNAALQVNLDNLGLKPLQTYINDFARIELVDGVFHTNSQISVQQPAQGEVNLRIKGNAGVKQLVMRDQLRNQELVKWRALKLDGLDVDLGTQHFAVNQVLLQQPYARVTIKPDRTLNFNDLIIPAAQQTTPPAKPSTSKTKTLSPQYKIGAITIDDGSSDFSDFSLILPFVVQLNDLNGAIKRFTSTQKQLTDFALNGKVFGLSPMSLAGQLSPDLSQLAIDMHFKGTPLPLISPYMVEFAGYKIEKGKMSLDLSYQINNRQLIAENNAVLDQLTLGEKVENPKATTLPLSLAISLLKDADGKITLNLPITGSLDDPQFSVGRLAFDTLVNMLTKIISSPFKALGSLVSSDADLSQVNFKEGSETLTPEEQAKLQELAKGLSQKPALNVEIKGYAYTQQDWPALQKAALVEQLKGIKAAKQKKSTEQIQLSEDEYQQLLADLFIQKFPHLGKRSLLGSPELINSTQNFTPVAEQQLASVIPPDQQKLAALASTRARNIAHTLIHEGKINHERIFILDSSVQTNATDNKIVSNLTLNAQ